MLPVKYDTADVVDIKFPTVSCVPVAMIVPAELVVTIELGASVAREVNGTLDTVRAPEELVRPVPSRLLNDEPLTTRLVVDAVTNDE